MSEQRADKHPYGPIFGWTMIWTLLGVFAGGLALNLTPCVYPLIPITISYFGTQTGRSSGRLVLHGILYLVGLAATNSVLGVTAALTGSLMGSVLQNPVVLIGVAAVLVFFAASLFGFWELRLPSSLTNAASKSYAGFFGSLFMGITLGVVAAPCLGPFVLGLLTWVATVGNPWFGFLIFFTLSLGLGFPLVILGLFSGSIENLPGSGEWLVWVRKLMGWILVGMAAYFLRPLLPKSLGLFLIAAVALSAGLHLGWFDRTRAAFRGFEWLRTGVGLAGVVMATVLIGSWIVGGQGVYWQPYSIQLLKEAQEKHKPVIIDFSAAWCTPCREMEEITFRNPDVVKQAESDFVMVKVDLTTKDGNQEKLVTRYGIKGVPTILFLDRKGREVSHLRLVDFVPPDQFMMRMARVRQES